MRPFQRHVDAPSATVVLLRHRSIEHSTPARPASRAWIYASCTGKVNSGPRDSSGWVNYFHYRNSNLALEKVKVHAERRMRKHLMKRHKVKDRGIGEGRFPSVELYRRHGLYKVPTAAGWKSAHALA